MATRVIDDTKLQNIAVAIQSKDNGGQMTVDEMAGRIEAIPTGSPEPKTVNFYDFKGNLAYSYTAEEVAQLTELPEAPVIEGFTFQKWNYTLQKVKAWVQNHDAGELSVGGLYVTTDGHTRIKMRLREPQMASLAMPFCIQQMAGTVVIDWGDGSVPETITAAGIYSHLWQINQYPVDIIIDIDYTPNGNTKLVLGGDALYEFGIFQSNAYYASCVTTVEYGLNNDFSRNASTLKNFTHMTSVNITSDFSYLSNFTNCRRLKFIALPDSITSVGNYTFSDCTNLALISLPDSITNIGNYTFLNCTNLALTLLPDSITSIGQNAFSDCTNLALISLPDYITIINSYSFGNCTNLALSTLPDGVTRIGNHAFCECTSLTSITIPNAVAHISNTAFQKCTSLYVVDLTAFTDPQSIPVLESTNVFQGIPAEAQLQASNQEMYDAFTTATNWSTYASKFVIKGAA